MSFRILNQLLVVAFSAIYSINSYAVETPQEEPNSLEVTALGAFYSMFFAGERDPRDLYNPVQSDGANFVTYDLLVDLADQVSTDEAPIDEFLQESVASLQVENAGHDKVVSFMTPGADKPIFYRCHPHGKDMHCIACVKKDSISSIVRPDKKQFDITSACP